MFLKRYGAYVIAFCATVVRYYDYSLFGLSAGLLSKNFMPNAEGGDQILGFFGLFSLSMVVRPLGSILFGKFGDKFGRIASVKIAMVSAAIATGLIAILPSFAMVGWVATVLLFVCRMLFLLSLAGEIDAIRIYISEKIHKSRRNFATGVISFSSQIGILLASVMYYFTVSFEELEWLWRLNFLLGAVLGFGIILARGALQENEIFLSKKKEKATEPEVGILAIINENKVKFFASSIIHGMLGGIYHFLIMFLGLFVANVANIESQQEAMFDNMGIIALYSLACLVSGFIADKVNILVQAAVAIMLSVICMAAMVGLLNAGIFSQILHYALGALAPFYVIPSLIKTQSMFKMMIRMRMFSISHSVGSLVLSSTTPFMCMLIWKHSGSITMVFSYFLIQLLVLFAALSFAVKKHSDDLFEV
jgi:MFS family permease